MLNRQEWMPLVSRNREINYRELHNWYAKRHAFDRYN